MLRKIDVFFSYAHEDEKYKDELIKHLSILKREKMISTWHDRKIIAGSDLDKNIIEKLESSDIILLLISSDFMASDYCCDIEMDHAMRKHNSGLARVIPIIVRPTADWNRLPIGKLMALPKDAKPISTWDNQDSAYVNISNGIRKSIEDLGLLDEDQYKSNITALPHDWKLYYNGRFGFSVQYPPDWGIGRESDNGDGVELYIGNPEVDIRAYAFFYNPEYESPYKRAGQPGYRMQRLNLNNGLEAELIVGKIENVVTLDMIQIIGKYEYHLLAEVSDIFFEKNESKLLQAIMSFDATCEGIENLKRS